MVCRLIVARSVCCRRYRLSFVSSKRVQQKHVRSSPLPNGDVLLHKLSVESGTSDLKWISSRRNIPDGSVEISKYTICDLVSSRCYGIQKICLNGRGARENSVRPFGRSVILETWLHCFRCIHAVIYVTVTACHTRWYSTSSWHFFPLPLCCSQ